jgi:acyl-CoA thioesterase-1
VQEWLDKLRSRKLDGVMNCEPVLCAGLRTMLCVLALGLGSAAIAAPRCPPTAPQTLLRLPHFQAALAGSPQALIVALGSSSTEGVAASDPAHDYPAALQAALTAALPHSHIAVLNRGIGGQDAPEELARLDADVLAVRPQLVIWQVGANGAMRNADPAEFKRLVTEGVRRLQAAGTDVILMDNQRAPRVDASPDHVPLEAALREIAQETGAGLFSRGALMDAWSRAGIAAATFLAADQLHHNDQGYFCVAGSLADGILAGVQRAHPVTASR